MTPLLFPAAEVMCAECVTAILSLAPKKDCTIAGRSNAEDVPGKIKI
jgi:hypothetical protein